MKKLLSLTAFVFFLSVMLVQSAFAFSTTIDQYATSVIGYSSEYSTGPGAWSAADALGAPSETSYGDHFGAWAPSSENGTLEYLTLGFATPVYASGATIWESCGNGFVYQVDLVDVTGAYHTVWTGTDNSQSGSIVAFQVSWLQTPYVVDGIKIYVDTNHDLSTWEEIDAVQLTGVPTPIPPTAFLIASGLIPFIRLRKKGLRKKVQV